MGVRECIFECDPILLEDGRKVRIAKEKDYYASYVEFEGRTKLGAFSQEECKKMYEKHLKEYIERNGPSSKDI